MRRLLLTLLITFAVLVPAAACGSEPERATPADDTPAPSAGASSADAPSATGAPSPSATGASRPSVGTGPRPAPSRTTSPPAVPPPPTSGELPGGLPFGERKLTGVVERSGDCTMLRVGTRLWELTGTPAGGLAAGDRVTVEGQVTTPGANCAAPGVTRALVVRRVE